MTRFSFLALALIGFLALGGCSTAPPAGRADPVSPDAYPRIAVLDGMKSATVFGIPRVTQTPDAPMTVTVPVRSTAKAQFLNIEYRIVFFDMNGRPLEPAMGFKDMQLPRRLERYMTASALDQRAVDWRLEVREQK